jgi:hypothetical protein
VLRRIVAPTLRRVRPLPNDAIRSGEKKDGITKAQAIEIHLLARRYNTFLQNQRTMRGSGMRMKRIPTNPIIILPPILDATTELARKIRTLPTL